MLEPEVTNTESLQPDMGNTARGETAPCADAPTFLDLALNRPYDHVKRVLDVLMAVLLLVVLSPFLLILALAIYIDDPKASPVYVSKRCGKNGKVFNFYKFRTMCTDADEQLVSLLKHNEMDGPVFKMKEDPRITRIGKALRKYSIDEFLQLINVLKGDMSIVGPRPPIPREVELYNERQRQRLSIRPGLTCYWQVQPKRNDIPFDWWVDWDIRYIRERGFWVDVRLVLRTFKAIWDGEGI